MTRKYRHAHQQRPWENSSRTLFGWIDGAGGRATLVLSRHSQVAIARENRRRLRADMIERLEAAGIGLV